MPNTLEDLLKIAEQKGIPANLVITAIMERFSKLNHESRKPRDFTEAMSMLRNNWKKAFEEVSQLIGDGAIHG